MEDQKPLPPAPSIGNTLTDVFTSPSDVFQNLKGTASAPMLWVASLLAMIILVIITSVIIFTNESLKMEMKETQSKAVQKMVEEGKLTQEQADQAESRFESMGTLMIVFGIVGGTIFVSIYYFGGALALWLANKIIFKSSTGYGKHLEMYGISSWIGILGGIITLMMIVGMGTMSASPSAALAVIGSYDPLSHFHKLLSSINIFSIWQMIAVGIGLSKLSGKSAAVCISVSFGLWAIWVAIAIFLGIAR